MGSGTQRATAAVVVMAILLVGATLAVSTPTRAATHAVGIGDGFFAPASLTVTVGDTVTWTNGDDSPHTVTDAGGAFDSGNLEAGASFSFTFAEPGTYTYVCQYHEEMVATITVVPAAAVATAPPQGGVAVPQAGAPTTAPSVATPPAAAAPSHAAHGEQPNTALPLPAGRPWLLAPALIALGLVGIGAGLVPRRSAAPAADRRPGGRRR